MVANLFVERLRSPGGVLPKLCLVLGGGASLQKAKRDFLQHFATVQPTASWSPSELDARFDRYLEEGLPASQRAAALDFLSHQFEALQPSDSYKLLVLLAKEGLLDAVVTTNFDNLLEAAERELGLSVFQTYAAGVSLPFVAGDQLLLPSRPKYLKLRGDLEAKVVTGLTSEQARGAGYAPALSLLLRNILGTHQVLFLGYSGHDASFARELQEAGLLPEPVYWCGSEPLDASSPLGAALTGAKVEHVRCAFDEALTAIADASLSKSALLPADIGFIEPLVAQRIRRANQNFLENYAFPERRDRASLIRGRAGAMDAVSQFRSNTERPLLILVGESGLGKTSLLVRLHDASFAGSFPEVLLLSARSFTTTEVEREVAEALGYLSENSAAVVYQLSTWLRKKGLQLLVAVDGLNEFASLEDRCIDLVKRLVRLARWLQPHATIRIIATIRPRSWQDVYSRLDTYELRRLLWSNSRFDDSVGVVRLQELRGAELKALYHSYAEHYAVETPFRHLRSHERQLLSDPYLLALAMAQHRSLGRHSLAFDSFERLIKDRLIGAFGSSEGRRVETALARLVGKAFRVQAVAFTDADLEAVGLSDADCSKLLDSRILTTLARGTYGFWHERLQQAFLTKAIVEQGALEIGSKQELAEMLVHARQNDVLSAALRETFVHMRAEDSTFEMGLVVGILRSGVDAGTGADTERRACWHFANDVLLGIASAKPGRFLELARGLLPSGEAASETGQLKEALIRASSVLPLGDRLRFHQILLESNDPAVLEISSGLRMKSLSLYLLEKEEKVQAILEDPVMSPFFRSEGSAGWGAVARCLGIISQLGPDNTSAEEWQRISRCIREAARQLAEQVEDDPSGRKEFIEYTLAHAHRFLFNSDFRIAEAFYMAPSRRFFAGMFHKLRGGEGLTIDDLEGMRPFVRDLSQSADFIICNLLVCLSIEVEGEQTMSALDELARRLSKEAEAAEVDFFLSAVFCALFVSGKSPHHRVESYTKMFMQAMPDTLLDNPGLERGRRRGRFVDPFDQQFEDGFNPLAFYFYSAPANERRRYDYLTYQNLDAEHDFVPLYWEWLERFEDEANRQGAVRIVHALGQMVSLWPKEGLHALERLLARTEPIIRRAIVRVLAEAYVSSPGETRQVLERAAGTFSYAEESEIRWRSELRLEERTLEQLQWARVLFFFRSAEPTRDLIWKWTEALVTSTSFPEALSTIFSETLTALRG